MTDLKTNELKKLLNNCRHSISSLKVFTACCMYCGKSLDEIIIEAHQAGAREAISAIPDEMGVIVDAGLTNYNLASLKLALLSKFTNKE